MSFEFLGEFIEFLYEFGLVLLALLVLLFVLK